MKRNKFGMSHKVKCSMDFGLWYPVLVQNMVPGDITRVDPEVIVKAVIPPVSALTDKIYSKIEFGFIPDRLLDDHFAANLSTTKTGTVKGNFKTWSLGQMANRYGSVSLGETCKVPSGTIDGTNDTFNGTQFVTPLFRRGRKGSNTGLSLSDNTCFFDNHFPVNPDTKYYNECFPVGTVDGFARSCPMFGAGSLMDCLGLEPNANIGMGDSDLYEAKFRTAPISAYYMYMNFYHTNPEYQRYLAPHFDYVQPNDTQAINEGRETLHRYESLEEEMGNGFVSPRLSGRCVNGLVIDNWNNDYFSHSTVDPQRGIAPTVPVSITGSSESQKLVVNCDTSNSQITTINKGYPSGTNGLFVGDPRPGFTGYPPENLYVNSSADYNSINASFVISDLRTALALQHFQEDTQYCYKWSDFLQKVYGTSPRDSLIDQPVFLGGFKTTLSSSEVLQTVQTENGNLGDMGGHLSGYGKGKRITFRAKEHGWFMAFMCIKVERTYESGLDRDFTRFNYLDMYFPQFTGIGNQGIRIDELCAHWNSRIPRDKNLAFTQRYEEMKHKRSRVFGKCRNDNTMISFIGVGSGSGGGNVPTRDYRTIAQIRKDHGVVPYLNDFHVFAIGDAYNDDTLNYKEFGISFDGINNFFLLCTPQLNDIFVDDSEEPFLVTLGFNMDMFRPLPVYTKPGIQYV